MFLAAGDPLIEVQREVEIGPAFAQRVRFQFVIDLVGAQLGLVRTLRGLTPKFGSFDDSGFHEREGHVLEANDAFLRMVGYDRDDLRAGHLSWRNMTPPEWREQDERLLRQHQITGRLYPFEKEYFRKDGSRVPVLIGVATFEEGGEQSIAFVLDLTERKRAEAALRESEEQWKAVFENNPTMYFMVDGMILSVNPFGAEKLGYSRDEMIGPRVEILFHEADRESARRNKAACLEHLGRTVSWELRKIRKDGGVLWVRETGRAMSIKNRPVVLIVSEDITEGKLATEALRETHNAIEAMSETSEGSRELLIATGKTESGDALVAVRDFGPRTGAGCPRATLRGLLHDQAKRLGPGAVDLPFDNRNVRRAIVGERQYAPRRGLPIHPARSSGQCNASVTLMTAVAEMAPSRTSPTLTRGIV